MDINVGDIVISKAGRDANRYFLVYDIENENYVWLVDGKLRKTNKPKKKKIRHLIKTDYSINELGLKLKEGKTLSNAEARKALAQLELIK